MAPLPFSFKKDPETPLCNKYFHFTLVKQSAMYWLLFFYYNNQNSCMRQKKELFWLCLFQNRYKKNHYKNHPSTTDKNRTAIYAPKHYLYLKALKEHFQ